MDIVVAGGVMDNEQRKLRDQIEIKEVEDGEIEVRLPLLILFRLVKARSAADIDGTVQTVNETLLADLTRDVSPAICAALREHLSKT